TLDLTMDSFTTLGVTSAIAPDPPSLNKSFSLVVRVARRTVDENGVVRGQPIQNAIVAITGAQGFAANGQSTAQTDGNGDAGFSLVCKAAGASQLQVSVRALPADVPQVSTLTLSACDDPNATTTTSSGSSSSGSGSSSSSSSSSQQP